MPEAAPELPRIPGCRLERLIARGGMAEVYLAVQENLNRRVAVKILSPALFNETGFTERFYQEATTAAALQHPGIISVHDVGCFEGQHYIVMEYLPCSLKFVLEKGALTPNVALRIFRTVAIALDHAHTKGFVHRDVKPDNILLREDGSAVLADFGISRAIAAASRLTRTGMSIGTPHYMSPEQARGLAVDGRSDLYSLGIVLFEMLAGTTPFKGDHPVALAFAHVQQPIPELHAELARYQPLLSAMLAKEPQARPQSGSAAIALLDHLDIPVSDEINHVARRESSAKPSSTGIPCVASTVSLTKTAAQSPRFSRRLVMSLSIALLLLFLVLGVYTWRRGQTRSLTVADDVAMASSESSRQGGTLEKVPERERRIAPGDDRITMMSASMPSIVMNIDWIRIPSGAFNMGAVDGQTDEHPPHVVFLDEYHISRYEITFSQYDAFCDATGRSRPPDDGWGRGDLPVINVSWTDARSFCSWLSKEARLKIDLPTEAQWEKACKSMGEISRIELNKSAWFLENSASRIHPVGQWAPIASGIQDIFGNAEEWCRDWYSSNYYRVSPRENPLGPERGKLKVSRGGSFFSPASVLTPSFRNAHEAEKKVKYLGFRIVCH